MDADAIATLVSQFQEPKQIGDFILRPDDWTVEDPAALVKPGPRANTLIVATLGAVRDYLEMNRDALELGRLVVHIVTPNQVTVLGPLSARDRTREAYVSANCVDLLENFVGRFHALTEFLLGLQIRFADGHDRARLLSLLSNVKDESVKTALDDGITQIVQARAGIALVSEVAVPNPVTLTPYRTFRDIVQPDVLFVLRVQTGPAGGLPTVGLFEADGGAWRLSTVEGIEEWLRKNLPSSVAILA